MCCGGATAARLVSLCAGESPSYKTTIVLKSKTRKQLVQNNYVKINSRHTERKLENYFRMAREQYKLLFVCVFVTPRTYVTVFAFN